MYTIFQIMYTMGLAYPQQKFNKISPFVLNRNYHITH